MKETMEQASEKKFPVSANDYKLYEEVGDGVSATVYRALCIPLNEIVAIKVLDLERCNNDLDGIRREVQTLTLTNHSNLLRAHCSFTAGHNLWVVMPYMAAGSCLHIMKSAYPEGFEEPVIATLLREVLKALVYLHAHGHIHRDVKAGNILLDKNGAVKLADFGVSACMFDSGDRQRSRNTFVGTPCWMAPEVMQQLHGYDFKADIWSFGITALELAHGHAPFSKYPPMKVLLMTLQNAPPGLDYERDKRFSKSFRELVAACLVKDPKKRPSSEKLLKHHFFKQAKSNAHLVRTILDGLPPLGERYRNLKTKEADLLLHNKSLNGDKEQLSQQEYMRGISAWNFNLEDLKNQAALIPDGDGASTTEDSSVRGEDNERCNESQPERLCPEKADQLDALPRSEDELSDIHDLEGSLAGFPIQSLQGLKGCFDVCGSDALELDSEQQNQVILSTREDTRENGITRENGGPGCSQAAVAGKKKYPSGPLLQDGNLFTKKFGEGDREIVQARCTPERNYSGPMFRQRKETTCLTPEDTSEKATVQRKGRFKVTSAELSPKGPVNTYFNPNGGSSSTSSNLPASPVLPTLQGILHQNSMQKEEILRLIKFVEQTSGSSVESSEIPSASGRERELQTQVIQLQQSIGSLVEELQRQKLKNIQMEKKLNTLVKK